MSEDKRYRDEHAPIPPSVVIIGAPIGNPDGSLLSVDHRESQMARLRQRVAELEATIARSGMDISCCKLCNKMVVCIPDGLPMCDACAAEEEKRQA